MKRNYKDGGQDEEEPNGSWTPGYRNATSSTAKLLRARKNSL